MKNIDEVNSVRNQNATFPNVHRLMSKRLILLAGILTMVLSACDNKDVTVWIATPWQQVLQNTPPGDVRSVTIKAASNEYEPFRLIVHNSGKINLTDLNVTVSNLKSNDGEITATNIKLYRANYLNVTKPSNRSKNPAGFYPDALIPFIESAVVKSVSDQVTYVAAPFSVDTASNAEIWCDLYVPDVTKPGTYSGEVTLAKKKKKIAEIPVTLIVWDFELPAEIAMLSHFGSLNSAAVKLMGIEAGGREFLEMEDLYNHELLKHRAVPSTPGNIWPEWNEKDGVIERGEGGRLKKLIETDHFNTIDIPFRYKDEPKKCKAYLAATAKWLKSLGYLDKAYIYLEDEPNDAKEYAVVRQQGALIKAADPGIARLCTEQTITSDPEWGNLYGAVDIWCPLWGLWDEKTAVERLAKGEKLWSYTALCQRAEGTLWWQVDMDPINFRVPMWLSWHYDITGFLYWSSVYWGPYGSLQGVWEAPYFRKNFWGEGMLLYPGHPAGVKGFVPSIRLKLYREAAEDYEYMILAAKSGRSDEVDKIVNSLVTNFQQWNRDNAAYADAREKLADLIMK